MLPIDNFWKDSSKKSRKHSYYCKTCDRQSNKGAVARARARTAIPCLKQCGKLVKPEGKTGMCHLCLNKSKLNTGKGYKTKKKYIMKRKDGKAIAEHRIVMEEFLGRDLTKGENVHHINGVRDDNRIENLELWVSHQPSGQRVEDLIDWARYILDKYDNK